MQKHRRLGRGIYLLPTIFTIGNLFCGFYALILASRGDFERGALMIIVAGVLDGLDGRIARMTHTTTAFGTEFDSLSDIVSFGVAPAMLAFHWALAPLGRIGWLVPFLFVVCAAMRLARFNIKSPSADKRFFAGLPSPGAAGALAALVFAVPDLVVTEGLALLMAGLVVTLGLLMLSTFRYRSFKDLGLANRRSYMVVLPLAAMLVAVAVYPKLSLVTLAILYLISAPVGYVTTVVRGRIGKPAPKPTGEGMIDGPVVR